MELTLDFQKISVETNNNNHNSFEDTHINRCDYGSLKNLPSALLNLLKNKTFMSISIGAALDAFLLAGNEEL